ncbi:MAG: biopolymer transporter ExbD [Rhodocyclaceae bacterium]|nr:biopolymer transporter ExbD [Rhodocyclaceae bacterium]
MAFGDFNQGNGGAPMSEINTTPLVDVMLVLLIIFMVTAPLMTQNIAVDLPKADAVASRDEPVKVSLEISADGQLSWDKQAIDGDELARRLTQAAATRPQPELHLLADRKTDYEHVAQVLAAARAAGLDKVGFVTLPAAR